MAKIQHGPLIGSMSGSIGNVTFEATRFGQVAQTKPVPPVHTTAPAMLTKARFRNAMTILAHIDPALKQAFAVAAGRIGHAASQDWVSAYYNLQKYSTWNMPLSTIDGLHLVILSATQIGNERYWVTNLDANPVQYAVRIVSTWNGHITYSPGGSQIHPLTIPPTPWPHFFALPAYTFILFPHPIGSPFEAAYSAADVGFAP